VNTKGAAPAPAAAEKSRSFTLQLRLCITLELHGTPEEAGRQLDRQRTPPQLGDHPLSE